jgi:hypothetical protein
MRVRLGRRSSRFVSGPDFVSRPAVMRVRLGHANPAAWYPGPPPCMSDSGTRTQPLRIDARLRIRPAVMRVRLGHANPAASHRCPTSYRGPPPCMSDSGSEPSRFVSGPDFVSGSAVMHVRLGHANPAASYRCPTSYRGRRHACPTRAANPAASYQGPTSVGPKKPTMQLGFSPRATFSRNTLREPPPISRKKKNLSS